MPGLLRLIDQILPLTYLQAIFEEEQLKLYSSELKLVNMASHRWCSADAVIERFISMWRPIFRSYFFNSKPFPLLHQQKHLKELYALLHPTTEIIKLAQSNQPCSGPRFLLKVTSLVTDTLSTTKPLKFKEPGWDDKNERVEWMERSVLNYQLTDIGQTSRRLLRQAVLKRFVNDRYLSTGTLSSSYIFDQAALAHPDCIGMRWIDDLADGEGEWMCR